MKCYLHIGTEKTATTTLQECLYINKEELSKNKFFLPSSVGIKNNRALSVAAFNVERRDDFTRSHGIQSNDELFNFQQRVIKSFREEVQYLKNHHNDTHLLLTSEHFQSRLTTDDEVQRLKSILNHAGLEDIQVIVYLRNPPLIANSFYTTLIKCGGTEPQPGLPDQKYYNNLCNHEATLKRFGNIFGFDNILPRIFEKNSFVNGSVIDDFLASIGLTATRRLSIPDNKNKAMSALGLEILRRLNLTTSHPLPQRAELIRHIEDHLTGTTYTMPHDLIYSYEQAFQGSNEWVRKHFFPDRERLFYSQPLKPTQTSFSEDELESLTSLIRAIWLKSNK